MKNQASGELGYDIAGAAVEPPIELPNGVIAIKINFLDAKKFQRECEDGVLYEQTADGRPSNCERVSRSLGKGADSLPGLLERQAIVKSVQNVQGKWHALGCDTWRKFLPEDMVVTSDAST